MLATTGPSIDMVLPEMSCLGEAAKLVVKSPQNNTSKIM
jgi:hypothetical protein